MSLTYAQDPPNVYQVILFSQVSNPAVDILDANGHRVGSVTLTNSLANVFRGSGPVSVFDNSQTLPPTLFTADSAAIAVASPVNQIVATTLPVMSLATPASAVIENTLKDPATGAKLPGASNPRANLY